MPTARHLLTFCALVLLSVLAVTPANGSNSPSLPIRDLTDSDWRALLEKSDFSLVLFYTQRNRRAIEILDKLDSIAGKLAPIDQFTAPGALTWTLQILRADCVNAAAGFCKHHERNYPSIRLMWGYGSPKHARDGEYRTPGWHREPNSVAFLDWWDADLVALFVHRILTGVQYLDRFWFGILDFTLAHSYSAVAFIPEGDVQKEAEFVKFAYKALPEYEEYNFGVVHITDEILAALVDDWIPDPEITRVSISIREAFAASNSVDSDGPPQPFVVFYTPDKVQVFAEELGQRWDADSMHELLASISDPLLSFRIDRLALIKHLVSDYPLGPGERMVYRSTLISYFDYFDAPASQYGHVAVLDAAGLMEPRIKFAHSHRPPSVPFLRQAIGDVDFDNDMIVFIDGVLPRQKLVWSANNCLSLSGLLEVAQTIPLVATSKKCALSDATHPYDDKTMARDVVTPPTHKVAPKGVWLGFSLRDLAVKICPDGAAVATKPLIVYYTASWCGNCKRFYPIIIELGKRLSDKVSLAILEDDPTNYSAIQRDFMMPRVPKNVFPRLMLYRQGDNGAGEAFEGVICNPSIVVAEMSLQPGTSLDTLIKQLDDLIV